MADDESQNTFASVVSDFLLNPEIRDEFSLEEFKNFFPERYRAHEDVKCLYNSFVAKRKSIEETVRKNIHEFFKVKDTANKKEQQQNIEEVIEILEIKRKQSEKELLKAKNELEVLESNIVRCDKAVQDCHLMKTNYKKYFDMEIFKELDSCFLNAKQNGD